mgnify:FL=1
MKILIKFFFFIFLLITSNSQAEIFYIDLDKIINQSEPGIFINKKINILKKKNNDKILSIKEDLKKREDELIKQKNILDKDEFNIKLNKLKTDINNFNKENQKRLKEHQNKLISYKSKLLKLIKPILLEYVSKNNIKYLLQKKYIIVGHNDLNKTADIIEIINQNIDTSNFND